MLDSLLSFIGEVLKRIGIIYTLKENKIKRNKSNRHIHGLICKGKKHTNTLNWYQHEKNIPVFPFLRWPFSKNRHFFFGDDESGGVEGGNLKVDATDRATAKDVTKRIPDTACGE